VYSRYPYGFRVFFCRAKFRRARTAYDIGNVRHTNSSARVSLSATAVAVTRELRAPNASDVSGRQTLAVTAAHFGTCPDEVTRESADDCTAANSVARPVLNVLQNKRKKNITSARRFTDENCDLIINVPFVLFVRQREDCITKNHVTQIHFYTH